MPDPTTPDDDGPLAGQLEYEAHEAELGAAAHDGEQKERERIKKLIRRRMNSQVRNGYGRRVYGELRLLLAEIEPSTTTIF